MVGTNPTSRMKEGWSSGRFRSSRARSVNSDWISMIRELVGGDDESIIKNKRKKYL